MLSREERQHLAAIKAWNTAARAQFETLQTGTLAALLKHVGDPADMTRVFDNMDWLVGLIEREEHRYGVRALTKGVKP